MTTQQGEKTDGHEGNRSNWEGFGDPPDRHYIWRWLRRHVLQGIILLEWEVNRQLKNKTGPRIKPSSGAGGVVWHDVEFQMGLPEGDSRCNNIIK